MDSQQNINNNASVPQVSSQVGNFKVYTKNTIPIVAFLLGPVGACYMLAKNFESFGDRAAAKKTWTILIVAMVIYGIYVVSPFTIPFINSLPILYTIIIYSRTNDLQGKILDEHIKNGGKAYSGWKAFGVGILSLVITLVYIFALALFIKPLL